MYVWLPRFQFYAMCLRIAWDFLANLGKTLQVLRVGRGRGRPEASASLTGTINVNRFGRTLPNACAGFVRRTRKHRDIVTQEYVRDRAEAAPSHYGECQWQ